MDAAESTKPFVEAVEVRGHIIDSLILPKILDVITQAGGTFRIKDIAIGHAREDSSFALVEIQSETDEQLQSILANVTDHGAVRVLAADCRCQPADIEGTFPEGFYSTTNQLSEVRLDGEWIQVDASGNGLWDRRRSSKQDGTLPFQW